MKKFLKFTNKESFNKLEMKKSKQEILLSDKKNKIFYKSGLLCTISGGQDSIVNFFTALHVFAFFNQKQFKVISVFSKKITKIKVIYCQHFWQTQNFFLNFDVFQISYNFDSPYIFVLPKQPLLSENKSRRWRKKTFYRVSQFEKLRAVTTGHSETDTIEKNLNNLIRGTSSKGFRDFVLLENKKSLDLFFTYLIFQLKKPPSLQNISKTISFYCIETLNQNSLYPESLINPIFFWFKTTEPFALKAKGKKEKFSFFSKKKQRVVLKNYKKFHTIIFSDKSLSLCFYSGCVNRKINFIKFLETKDRSTILKLAKFYKLPINHDKTNFSSGISRNKIRHNLIPFFNFLFHPQKQLETLFLKFFSITTKEAEEVEKEILKLVFLSQFVQKKFSKKTSITIKFLTISKNLVFKTKLQGSFFKKILVIYLIKEIDFKQIYKIKKIFI